MLRGKIVVVGAGFVGSTTAYTIMLDGFFREIVLIDVNKDKADGDALDIVLPDDLGQLLGIVRAVQLGTAHEGDMPLDEPLVEIGRAHV